MILRIVCLATACAALLLIAASSWAHQLMVSPSGSVQLDVGTVEAGRLIHVTLEHPNDELEVAIKRSAQDPPLRILVLVPDLSPERRAARAELPTLDVGVPVLDEWQSNSRMVDAATGIAYRMVTSTTWEPAMSDRIVVRRGATATRAVLLVDRADAPFRAERLRNIPRTLVRLRAWAATPAVGGAHAPDSSKPRRGSRVRALYAAALAVTGIIAAGWWVRAGRRRSRERGVERSRD